MAERKLRIGYNDAGFVKEGGDVMLSLVAGFLARRYNALPTVADLEGLVYETPIAVGSFKVSCEHVAREVEHFVKAMAHALKYHFEDAWTRLPLPAVECE